MKKITLLLGLTVSVLVTSCDKIKDLANIEFAVPYKETVDVPGLPNNPNIPVGQGIITSIPPIGTATESEKYIKQYNTSSDLIEEVKLGKLDLRIEAPAGQTFDIVDSLWVFISSTASGANEHLAAYSYNIPNNAKEVSLTPIDLNLKSHFLQDSMYFRLQGHFKGAPDSATRLTIDTRFDAVANPLNK